MKTVKIFTFIDRPKSPFLPLWVDYYTKNINADLCILQKNVHLGKLNVNSNIEVINVDHFFDDVTKNQYVPPVIFFNTYQKQFLQTHDVVIYCDVDEFIIHNNLDDIIRSNFNPCLVTTGIEIVEKYPTDSKFNFTEQINKQRSYMVRSKWYDKPLIVNNPINWLDGKHNHNVFNTYVDGLYLIHLGRICMKTCVRLWKETQEMYPKTEFVKNFEQWYIDNFTNPNHLEQPMVEIPNNINEFLNKIL